MKSIELPNRLLKIYQYIYQHPNITIDDLAQTFGRTTRSMYSYIKEINEIIRIDANTVIFNRETKGYYIEDFASIFEKNTVDNQEERVFYLVQCLLLSKSFMKIDELSDQLYVSTQTIKKDIKIVKQKLKSHKIIITQKPYYGIKVHGRENNIRKALIELVMDHRSVEFTKEEKEFFHDIDVYALSYCLLSVFNGNHISVPDYQIKSLVFHVAIALKRIKQGLYIEEVPDIEVKDITVFDQAMKKCEEFFSIIIPEIERVNLYIHFVTKITYISINDLGRNVYIEQIAKDFIRKLDTKYDFKLGQDRTFVKDIILHLEAFIKRLELGMGNRNPLLAEIKKRYSFEYDITLHGMKEIIKKYGVSEDEIGFFALHVRASLERNHHLLSQKVICVTLVCSTGLGTKRLVETKLLNVFGEQMVIEMVISYYEYLQLNSIRSDLVITTINIPKKDKPVIIINPLLSKKDELKLRNTMYQLMNNNKFSYKLFKPSLFKIIDTKYTNKDELLKELASELEEKGFVDSNYYQEVLKREKISSTALGYLIAIPHTIESPIKDSFIYICILRNSLLWDENRKVKLVFLLGIKNNDLVQTRLFNHILANYLDNSEATKLLINASTFEEFKTEYMRFLDKD